MLRTNTKNSSFSNHGAAELLRHLEKPQEINPFNCQRYVYVLGPFMW